MERSPKEITITSGNNSARILPHHGGTVMNLCLESNDGHSPDLLWRRKPQDVGPGLWPDGGIPILFPFAGRVWVDGDVGRYRQGERVLPMGIHGFLYRSIGKLLELEASRATLEFLATADTLTSFPWNFRIVTTYEIDGPSFQVTVTVTNSGQSNQSPEEPMPVALGFHPYFKIGTRLRDTAASISLAGLARRCFRVTSQGDLGDLFDENRQGLVDLGSKEFQNAILEYRDGRPIEISDKSNGARTVLRTTGPLEYLVLWGEPDSSFICVEPWMAPPDAPHRKGGARFLARDETLTASLKIRLDYGSA